MSVVCSGGTHEKQNLPQCETRPGLRSPRGPFSDPRPRAGGGLGRGSKPGQRHACIRPQSQPVLQTAPSQRLDSAAGVLGPQDSSTSGRRPCPGEGAFPARRHTHDLSRCHSFLREQRTPPGAWVARKKQIVLHGEMVTRNELKSGDPSDQTLASLERAAPPARRPQPRKARLLRPVQTAAGQSGAAGLSPLRAAIHRT